MLVNGKAISRDITHGESQGRSLNVCKDLKPNLMKDEGGPALSQQQFDTVLVALQYLPAEASQVHTSTSSTTSLQYTENSKFRSRTKKLQQEMDKTTR